MKDSSKATDSFLTSFNKIFDSLKSNRLKKKTDLIDAGLLVDICCEMDSRLFNPLKSSILNDRSFGILIADLKEVKDKMLRLLKLTGENFKPSFDAEISQLDVMLLAKYNTNEIAKLEALIVLCIFFCEEKDTLIDRIDKLNEDSQSDIYAILKNYVPIEDGDEPRNSIKNVVCHKNTNDNTEHFLYRIKELEDQLIKESENKDLAAKLQSELDETTQISYQYQNDLKSKDLELDLIKAELKGYKEKIQQFQADTKKIDEIKQTMNSFETKAIAKEKELKELSTTFNKRESEYLEKIAQLNKKIEVGKEREIVVKDLQSKYDRLNKEFGLQREKSIQFDQLNQQYQELKNAVETNSSVPISQASKSEIERLKAILLVQERTLKEANKKISEYEIQIDYLSKQANEGQKVKTFTPEPINLKPATLFTTPIVKVNEDELNELNNKINELTNELKHCNDVQKTNATVYGKNMSEMQARSEKEFELVSSAMFHLGFKFWSMKYDYEEKLKINPNWLIKERQRYLNGDN